MAKVVYAKQTAQVTVPGLNHSVFVRIGTHWLDSDPVVKAHREVFTDDPNYGLQTTVPLEGDAVRRAVGVESATREPGEKRDVRVPGRG